MVPSKAICAPAQESDRNRNHSPLPGAERVPHFLLDTGGAGGGNTQSSPEGANYLSPGQRPISAKIRKALQPGFSPTIALCQGGRDLIPIGHDGLQRYSGRDRCRHPMKGKLEFTPSTADERFLPAGGSPRGKSRSPRGPVSGSIRPPATFHTTKPDCCGRPAWARDPIGQSISDA